MGRKAMTFVFTLTFLILISFLLCGFLVYAAESEVRTHRPSAPRLVAHAGGEIHGIRLTNSIQALDLSYKKGFRYIELDFTWTADGVPVAVHDWGNENWFLHVKNSTDRQSYKVFKESKTILDLQFIDLNRLAKWLSKHKDVFIITDIKKDNFKMLKIICKGFPHIAAQIIPQIYSFEEYDPVKDLGYNNIILTVYKLKATDNEIVDFCQDKKLFALTMEMEKGYTRLPEKIGRLGIQTFAHTVNHFNEYQKLRDNGVYGVYTDYFQPDHWVEK